MADMSTLVGFEHRSPGHQNSLDLFPNSWVSQFPPSSGLLGGAAQHFDDSRVTWAASVMAGLNGLSILELGPFEAYNTYQFQMAGAASVISIEASYVNFLKCLVVKNIFGLDATFLLGDFLEFLRTTSSSFDICWASGVLYHMVDPVGLLRGIRRVSARAFLWTQYYDEAVLSQTGNISYFDSSRDEQVIFDGRSITLHHRNYMETVGVSFSGGSDEFSYWMEKDDLMFILSGLGYHTVTIGVDNPNHPPGPAMFLLADASGRGEPQTAEPDQRGTR